LWAFAAALLTSCFAAPADAKTIDIGFRSGLAHCHEGGGYSRAGWYRPSDWPWECWLYQEQGFEFFKGHVMSSGFDFDFGGLCIYGEDSGSAKLARIDGQPFSLTSGDFGIFRVLGHGSPPGLEVRSNRGGYLLFEGSGVVRFRGPEWEDVELVSFDGTPGFGDGDYIKLRGLRVRVPEPVALLLFSVGAVGVAFRRARR
jgi:hypothetical protein